MFQNILLLRTLHRYCADAVTKSMTDSTEIYSTNALLSLINTTGCEKSQHDWSNDVKHTKNMLKHESFVCPSYKNGKVRYVDNAVSTRILNNVPHDVKNVTVSNAEEWDIEVYPFETKLHLLQKCRMENWLLEL